jgi:hypothetical protein
MKILQVLAVLPALALGACVLPYAVPPMRADFGAAHAFRADEPTAFHFAAGLHTASLGPETIPKSDVFDVGAGFVVDHDADGTRAKGIYGDGAWFLARATHARVAAGVRGEALFSGARWGSGAYARLSAELFSAGGGAGQFHTDDNCSGVYRWRGVPATGLYVEAGAQHLADGREAFVTTAGVSLRVPALAGVLLVLPGCGK